MGFLILSIFPDYPLTPHNKTINSGGNFFAHELKVPERYVWGWRCISLLYFVLRCSKFNL